MTKMPHDVQHPPTDEKGGGMHILVIDDGLEICELLQDCLMSEGFRVEAVHDGITGLERSLSWEHTFVILDIKLPGMDGFEVLRQIRQHSNIPILMLTGCNDKDDRIKCLQMGADDYLSKPFILEELLARIRTILRRSGPTSAPAKVLDSLTVGDIFLEPGSRRAYRNNEEIALTAAEFNLLEVLLSNAGQVIPREELVRRVQGRHHNPYDRSIDVHISRLRKKLSSHNDGSERIKAVRGVGHFYSLPAEQAQSEIDA